MLYLPIINGYLHNGILFSHNKDKPLLHAIINWNKNIKPYKNGQQWRPRIVWFCLYETPTIDKSTEQRDRKWSVMGDSEMETNRREFSQGVNENFLKVYCGNSLPTLWIVTNGLYILRIIYLA